jgi:hypothetical protein
VGATITPLGYEKVGEKRPDPYDMHITLSFRGSVTYGDADRLARLLQQYYSPQYNSKVVMLQLESYGGDSLQAELITKLLRQYAVSTRVAPGTECSSACSTICMAGHTVSAGQYSDIGVHRPGWSGREDANTMQWAYRVATTLRENGAPEDVVQLMQSTPNARIAFLSESQKQRHARWVPYYAPQLIAMSQQTQQVAQMPVPRAPIPYIPIVVQQPTKQPVRQPVRVAKAPQAPKGNQVDACMKVLFKYRGHRDCAWIKEAFEEAGWNYDIRTGEKLL